MILMKTGCRSRRNYSGLVYYVSEQSFVPYHSGLVTWMNFFSLNKFAARFQIVATAAKLASCFIIIVVGVYYYFVKGIFWYVSV